MNEKVKIIIRNNTRLQNEIKLALARQLININLLVKKEMDLLDEYDENIDLDLLYKMYIEVIKGLNIEELMDLFNPIESTFVDKVVNMEALFDTIMKRLKDINLEKDYDNTYKNYIVERYNNKKSLFIPESYLKLEDKGSYRNYSKLKHNIGIDLELNINSINRKRGDIYYRGDYRDALVEWDDVLELAFRTYDNIFGGNIYRISIPYEHRKKYYMGDDRREDINLGYTSEEVEIKKEPLDSISELVSTIEKELKRVNMYIELYSDVYTEEELLEQFNLKRKYEQRIEKFDKLRQAINEKKLSSNELKKVYK